jgi:HNH endonuclease
MGSQCQHCGRSFAFIERIRDWNAVYCNQCIQHIHQVTGYWMGILEREFPKNGISSQLEQAILGELSQQDIPPNYGEQLVQRLRYLRTISEITWGNITPIHTRVNLQTDEQAYFEVQATYQKMLKRQVQLVQGTLLGTDRRITFLSSTGKDSNTIQLDNIGLVNLLPSAIAIQTTKGRGGTYQVAHPLYIKAYIDTLVKRWKMQILIQREQAGSRLIPDHVRIQVLQKYANKCAWCGAYGGDKGVGLEMDHIQPFSKGGPSTIDNLQPLCGPCNKKKGNRL